MTCGALYRVVDFVEQAGERQNLALADELLVEVGVEELNFLAQRAGHFGLLHALGVGELFLAELQHLAVIQAEGQRADEQHRAQHQPRAGEDDADSRFEALRGRIARSELILRSEQGRAAGQCASDSWPIVLRPVPTYRCGAASAASGQPGCSVSAATQTAAQQWAQRRAAMGISLRHSGHFLVVGSAGGSWCTRAIRALIGSTTK